MNILIILFVASEAEMSLWYTLLNLFRHIYIYILILILQFKESNCTCSVFLPKDSNILSLSSYKATATVI